MRREVLQMPQKALGRTGGPWGGWHRQLRGRAGQVRDEMSVFTAESFPVERVLLPCALRGGRKKGDVHQGPKLSELRIRSRIAVPTLASWCWGLPLWGFHKEERVCGKAAYLGVLINMVMVKNNLVVSIKIRLHMPLKTAVSLLGNYLPEIKLPVWKNLHTETLIAA